MVAGRHSDTREITIRGVCLGAVITIVFITANTYLGLKTGLTFSSSIPAATISMSVLALMGGAGILENNIVQTQASAAGTLCNVILVIPGLVLIQYWHAFPIWQTVALCLLGGLFGVAYSVPLRRVLVVGSDLPYPEGVAAAEVLRAAPAQNEGESDGLRLLGVSAAAAAAFNLCASGFRLFPDDISGTLHYGQAVFRAGGSLSLALVGAGFLVRIGACLALLIGVFIAWGIAVPVLTGALPPQASGAADPAQAVWLAQVRLIGAGIIAVAGLWTVARLAKPMIAGFRPARRGPEASAAVRDIFILHVGAAVLALCCATTILFALFARGYPVAGSLILFSVVIVGITAVAGFFLAAACGYMAGLLGSSSSPISGIGILAVMFLALGLSRALGGDGATAQFVTAFTLFVASFVVTSCSIANDNLQDLKTGQIVEATPWKQQAALAIGVIVGALTLGPVLQLLYNAYGFADALPRPGMNAADAMAAPQAALVTQIARGIVEHHLNWTMLTIGGALGIVMVALEWTLERRGFSLPAMTVGIGVYLPRDVVLAIALGGVISWLSERAIARRADRAHADAAQDAGRHRGVLVASGFFVGESLVGVLLAAADLLTGKGDALAFGRKLQGPTLQIVGVLVFCVALAFLYATVVRPSQRDGVA